MDQIIVKQTVRRVTEARAALVRDNPFFGHLSMGLQLACAPCETACTDGKRLIFDPEFAEKLSLQELQFVTLHEVMHCVLEHCIRGRNLHSIMFNIACDIVVNSTILDMWGLDSFKIAGEEAMHLAPDGKEGRLYNAEEIYHMLLQRKKKDTGYIRLNLNVTGKTADGCGNASEVSKEKGLSNVDGKNGNGNMDIHSFDRHDLWQGISDKRRLKDDWNGRIRNVAKVYGDSMGVPQSICRLMRTLADRSRLDWKHLLHDFLQFDQYDYSFIPPDRRYADKDFYLPAFNINTEDGCANDIWVCVDTSASISDEELTCAMTEIIDAMRQAQLKGKLSFFDGNITEPEPFESEVELRKITPSGGGGTSFQIIFDYLREKIYPELPNAILIFTDGYARWPDEKDAMGVPVLWLISKSGKDDAPWGKVVKL